MTKGGGDADNDQLVWFALYGAIYVSFYFFTSPFVGNPELLTTWTPYVYLSMGLYGWLFAAAALHTPVQQLGLLESTIKQPISLLFPFFSVSFLILILLELLMTLLLPRVSFCLGMGWKPSNVTLLRSFANVLRNSAAISVASVALILHCDTTENSEGDPFTYNQHACEQLFSASSTLFVPASYRGAVVTWMVGMVMAITNFVLERISGIQMISFHWLSERSDGDESDGEEQHIHEKLPAEHRLPMVPWYSMFLFDTAFQLLISLKVFLGRFDHRSLQRALYPRDEEYLFDHLAERDDLWLDFMADCGDGFNSSYHIARLLAQRELTVDCPVDLLDPSQQGDSSPRKKTRKGGKAPMTQRTFPRGEALVIGGDLAYPHPDPESYEKRLWRCFEYAMKPPADYDPRAISTGKPHLPRGVKSLADYDGPTAFAIPGNHDWFDGLNTFTRFVSHRDWLGGWLLPQKTSHFCLKLPHNWWLFGLDLALENDINTEQFELFERLTTKYLGENDRVIIVTHEPRWILDSYEEPEKTEEKLSYLVDHVLKGRVVLRLAGDIHNYTRHTRRGLERVNEASPQMQTVQPTKTASLSKPDSYETAAKPQGPPRRRPSLQSLLSQRALSPTRLHFPHMYTNTSQSAAASALAMDSSSSDNMQSPVRPGKLQRRKSLAEDLIAKTALAAHHLVIAGGGGAFLHPTHAPLMKTLQYKDVAYQQQTCYPPVHVSRRYALLNVFGFRRINWRFDIIGGLGYFLLVVSMFPRCSVQEIYSSDTWADLAVMFGVHIQQVLLEMLTTSYVSITTSVVMLVVVIAFSDCTALWKKCATGTVVALSHCIAASSILLVFECIFEIAIERGALGHEGEHSLYRYFSSSLPNAPNLETLDVFHMGQLFARFMQFCMTIFDVPEMVAIHRIKICASPLGIGSLSRAELWQYYWSLLPYFFVLATPVVGVVFGAYLYVALNVFGRHYNEAFSALRIASYKNFVRLHFKDNGDLELFAFGVDKMPSKWNRDPNWSGGTHMKQENQLPSHKWARPSYWQPKVTKVGNIFRIDFENPELDTHFNTSDRSNVHLIDRVLIQGGKNAADSIPPSSDPEISTSTCRRS